MKDKNKEAKKLALQINQLEIIADETTETCPAISVVLHVLLGAIHGKDYTTLIDLAIHTQEFAKKMIDKFKVDKLITETEMEITKSQIKRIEVREKEIADTCLNCIFKNEVNHLTEFESQCPKFGATNFLYPKTKDECSQWKEDVLL